MCGIAGVRRLGDKPITEHMIKMFLTGLEHRGNDATGMAIQQANGYINMLKVNVPAWNFIARDDYKQTIKEHLKPDTVGVILHTRAATKGNPNEPRNNHPMFKDLSMVVHNGVIHSDDEAFKKWKLERYAETDSDILRAITDEWGLTEEAIDKLDDLRGTIAIAAFHPAYPGKLLLGRSGSPLTIASSEDFFAFASEKSIIHRAMRPVVQRMGIVFQKQSLDLGFSPFPDNSCWILGEELEHYGAMRTCQGTYREPIRRVYNGWKARTDEWKKEFEKEKEKETKKSKVTKFIQINHEVETKEPSLKRFCPHCNMLLVLTPEQLMIDPQYLRCPKAYGGCGKTLEAPVIVQ